MRTDNCEFIYYNSTTGLIAEFTTHLKKNRDIGAVFKEFRSDWDEGVYPVALLKQIGHTNDFDELLLSSVENSQGYRIQQSFHEFNSYFFIAQSKKEFFNPMMNAFVNLIGKNETSLLLKVYIEKKTCSIKVISISDFKLLLYSNVLMQVNDIKRFSLNSLNSHWQR